MFSDRMARLRKNAGLNQKELADRLNISVDSIRRWEQNKRSPDVAMLSKLAKVLNTSVAYLCEETESEENHNDSFTTDLSNGKSFIQEGDFIGSGLVLFYQDEGRKFVLPATKENEAWFRDFMMRTIETKDAEKILAKT